VDTARFYDLLYKKYRTLVGPGHWFGMPDTYMRIGYGWPSARELRKGLGNITKALKEACK
jgi:aspartate/methionine/tyrosine aminotransferase